MCRHSEEGNTDCLGIFNTTVKKFTPIDTMKVPHVGWNTIQQLQGPLFKDISEHSFVYYVHSFYAEIDKETRAITNYINPFSASFSKDNFHAVQFHPEKSGVVGEAILKNFLTIYDTVIPAIDIISGKCVRLAHGDFSQKIIYDEKPWEVAMRFEDAGIKRLHLVDLDGAKQGRMVNIKVLEEISGITKLMIDFGGGIKTHEDMQIAFNSGASMISTGSIA